VLISVINGHGGEENRKISCNRSRRNRTKTAENENKREKWKK
jgi:hypothetical protein